MNDEFPWAPIAILLGEALFIVCVTVFVVSAPPALSSDVVKVCCSGNTDGGHWTCTQVKP